MGKRSHRIVSDGERFLAAQRPVICSSFSGYRVPCTVIFDAALSMSGESLGAEIEVAEAERLGVPVFSTIADLVGHFAGKASAAA